MHLYDLHEAPSYVWISISNLFSKNCLKTSFLLWGRICTQKICGDEKMKRSLSCSIRFCKGYRRWEAGGSYIRVKGTVCGVE